MILAGLRRHEVAALNVEHIQQLDGRWAIVDPVGKRGTVRTLPIAAIAKVLIDDWTSAAGITSGPLWREFRTARGRRARDAHDDAATPLPPLYPTSSACIS